MIVVAIFIFGHAEPWAPKKIIGYVGFELLSYSMRGVPSFQMS